MNDAPRVADVARFNVELKAHCARLDETRRILIQAGAVSHGVDRQTDTYFVAPRGRLKVREGNIENALIAYERPDQPGAKPCDVTMTDLSPEGAAGMRAILENVFSVKVRVVKQREILFLGNIKFHLDRVEGLGSFVEIEAQSRGGAPDRATLQAQAAEWQQRLGITADAQEPRSYSDLLADPAPGP
jgi:predicted adenylyl cyclase CyaB